MLSHPAERLLAVFWGACLALGCSGSVPIGVNATSAAETTLCSASTGPIAGPSSAAVDAGNIQVCQPGGQCLYVADPIPGPQLACDASDGVDEAGAHVLNCPSVASVPGWACVYVGGASGVGRDGG
jgi:hypothetical protein